MFYTELCPKCEASYRGSFDEFNHLACDALRELIMSDIEGTHDNGFLDSMWPSKADTLDNAYTREDLQSHIREAVVAALYVLNVRHKSL